MSQIQKNHHKKTPIFLVVFFIIILVAFLAVLYLDRENITSVLSEANLLFVVPAILFCIASTIVSSYAFLIICRLFDIKASSIDLIKLGFITISLANLLDLGGVGGYAVRISYLGNKGVQGREVLAISVLHTYLGFLNLLFLLSIGVAYIAYDSSISLSNSPQFVYGAITALGIIIVTTTVLLVKRLRTFLLRSLSKLIKKISKKDWHEKIDGFNDGLSYGLKVLREKKRNTLKIFVALTINWLLSVVALHFCFLSFGITLPFLALISGFSIGIFSGMFSFIPGGVGAQDGAMSGIFALLGIPFTTALLVALLFRIVFNIFPNFISILLYGQILGKQKE